MPGFLLFLSVLVAAPLLFGLGVGWLGRVLPNSWIWRLFWALAALFLPGVSLWGYLDETAQSAARMPETAHVMHSFQAQTVALFGLTVALTLWATLKKPWLAPLPLLGMFFVFARLLSPQIYLDGPLMDEDLYMNLDKHISRGFLILCTLGAALCWAWRRLNSCQRVS